MKIFLCFSVFLLSFSQFASSASAESTVNVRAVRAFSDFSNPVVWSKFEDHVQSKLIKGAPEPTIYTDDLFKLMFYSAKDQSLSDKTKESDKLFKLVSPDKRDADGYSELAKEKNAYRLNLGETITLKEIRRLATLKTNEGGFFFPVDTEYLQKLKEAKPVENDVELKAEPIAKTEKREVVLPKAKPKEVPVMSFHVDAVAARLAAIPFMQRQISELKQVVDEVVIKPSSNSGVVSESPTLKNEVLALSKKVDSLALSQEPLSSEQASSFQEELKSLQALAMQLTEASKVQGETKVVLDQESVSALLNDRQLLSKYPYFIPLLVAFLVIWLIIKIFRFFKNRSIDKKITVTEKGLGGVNKRLKNLEKSHTAIKTTITDIQANQVNLADGVEQVEIAQQDLKDEVKQVRAQATQTSNRMKDIEVRSSVQVIDMKTSEKLSPEKIPAMTGNDRLELKVFSDLSDDMPEYKIVVVNKNDNEVIVNGIWRDKTESGDSVVVYPKNTRFVRAFTNAYTYGRMVGVSDDKEVKVA